jgi:predicted nucleic acid-binding protein
LPTNQVFLNTSGLLAMINQSDELYPVAASVNIQLAAAKTPLVTSDWVLMEFLSGSAKSPLRPVGARMAHSLRNSRRTTVIEATRMEWDRAFELFRSYADKSWSLVDCSSMLICRDREISRVFTSDRHFLQFGLEILLDVPSP